MDPQVHGAAMHRLKQMKQEICYHYTNRHGDRVKSLSYWYYRVQECMLITFC